MNIGKILKSIFGSSAAQAVATFAVTEVQKAVAGLKTTAIGAAVAADIDALVDSRLSGSEKFERVVANTLPLIVTFVTTPGNAPTAIEEVESVARELVQSIYNDTRSTRAAGIATIILRILGIG
jgi:hypothetical protein